MTTALQVGAYIAVYASSANLTAPTDTSRNQLWIVTVPANLLGLNGFLEIVEGFTLTNNANVKTLEYEINAGSIGLSYALASTGSSRMRTRVGNIAAVNSQRAMNVGLSGGSVSPVTATLAFDTTASFTVACYATKATAGDSIVSFHREISVVNRP